MYKHLTYQCVFWLTTLVLSGCGDSSVSVDAPKVPDVQNVQNLFDTESLSSVGMVSELGSVTVNGINYFTFGTIVTVNGESGSVSDIKLGHVVSLTGELNDGEKSGNADRIDQYAMVVGPVEFLDAEAGQLIVMGQVIHTDQNTLYDLAAEPASLDGLQPGSDVAVSGFPDAAGEIMATLIEDSDADALVIGKVVGHDVSNLLFSINRLTVDYSGASNIDIGNGTPVNGFWVLARGMLNNGVLAVTDLSTPLYMSDLTSPGERILTEGTITEYQSATAFSLNGLQVTTDSGTQFSGGSTSDLAENVHITVDGEVSSDGNGIAAKVITFGRKIHETEVVTLDFDNFTEVVVTGVYDVTVIQDTQYSLEVTLDSDLVDRLLITESESNLTLDLEVADNNVQTLEAIIHMPQLDRIDLSGVSNVLLSGFDQQQLVVHVEGVSRFTGESLAVQALVADVSGVSQMDLGQVGPLASATIDVSGSSKVTLNMDVSSTLSGTVQGASSLLYYGTDVTNDLVVGSTASTTWLGDTRY
jgi:hypothetical protein